MKKLFALLLALMMLMTLAACGKDEASAQSGNGETPEPMQTEESNTDDPMQKLLSRAGLALDAIEPDEVTFDIEFDEDDDEFTFFMEKGTEKDTVAYLNKIMDACRAASDDGKLYEADFDFFMGSNQTEFALQLSAEEITGMYIMQFGYMKNGLTVCVTAASVTDMHSERADDVYYPVYTVSFSF